MNLKGSLVAIVTPFRDGAIDEETFTTLIEEQIEGGTNGIVVAGTTGESPTLTHEEHRRVIELCVKTVNGRIPVVAGTGSNATAEAVELTQHAASIGADAALLVNPYYNKPSQEGLFLHYKTIAESVDIPQIIYNIPGRTAGKVSVDTMARLGELKNIVGVKDAVGDSGRNFHADRKAGAGVYRIVWRRRPDVADDGGRWSRCDIGPGEHHA